MAGGKLCDVMTAFGTSVLILSGFRFKWVIFDGVLLHISLSLLALNRTLLASLLDAEVVLSALFIMIKIRLRHIF